MASGGGLVMNNTPQKCAKQGCNCMAPPGSKYCSAQCEDSRKFMTLRCNCGHPECGS